MGSQDKSKNNKKKRESVNQGQSTDPKQLPIVNRTHGTQEDWDEVAKLWPASNETQVFPYDNLVNKAPVNSRKPKKSEEQKPPKLKSKQSSESVQTNISNVTNPSDIDHKNDKGANAITSLHKSAKKSRSKTGAAIAGASKSTGGKKK